MNYEDRIKEIEHRRLVLENERDAIRKERKSLKGADDATIDRIIELEDLEWELHYKIMATYDEVQEIYKEIIDEQLAKVDRAFKETGL